MNILIDGEGSDQKWVKPRSALAKLQKLSFLRERYKAAKCCRRGEGDGRLMGADPPERQNEKNRPKTGFSKISRTAKTTFETLYGAAPGVELYKK
ncbi:hypothetical protein RYA99_21140 [Pseudomonas syringae pv. actinidifoliorum]|uniref:hypothetical protein n=1 Tax=Pseudomonas syringae TaxID=317 RepID=UPI001268D18A|nr:hypothetical protein [Pseudomonas syringae]MDU8431603.1 hypothetical protein [Pseudomonas syringae pv. actinidifoliorum]MDU8522363.1 hypothetical protein [Pseudomonas syringae pv. actinidifoliorum]MDU8528686.1 hypothetical protein [Pseudomonas syringae pv. actinidifoliorum]